MSTATFLRRVNTLLAQATAADSGPGFAAVFVAAGRLAERRGVDLDAALSLVTLAYRASARARRCTRAA